MLKPHTVFLFLAVTLGTLFVFLTPPFAAPDEPAHFLRSIELAHGVLFEQAHLPADLKAFIDSSFGFAFADEQIRQEKLQTLYNLSAQMRAEPVIEFPINRAVIYTPIVYIPAIIAHYISSAAGLSVIENLYLARLCTMLAGILMLYAAIRIMPVMKWPLVLLFLFPAVLHIRSSVTTDTLTNGFIVIFIATVLHYRASKRILGSKEIVWLACLALLLALSKTAYVFILLFLLILPVKQFRSTASYALMLALGIALPILASAAWSMEITQLYAAHPLPLDKLDVQNAVWSKPAYVNEAGQIQWMLNNPVKFLVYFAAQCFLLPVFFLVEMASLLLVPQLSASPILMTVIFISMYLLLDGSPSLELKLRERVFIALVTLATFAFILFMMYIVATPVGNGMIIGIQGRYFLPIVPLLLLLFSAPKLKRMNPALLTVAMLGLVIATNGWVLFKLFERYGI